MVNSLYEASYGIMVVVSIQPNIYSMQDDEDNYRKFPAGAPHCA